MKILVTGAKGMLGTDLVKLLQGRAEYDVFVTDIEELSITDEEAVRSFVEAERPGVIINCAAYTDVDACETEAEAAFAVNAHAPGILGRAARDGGARLIHVSTDFVFDGRRSTPYTEEDNPNPINAYGCSKREGEVSVRESGCRFVIARTAWLYGRNGKNFVDTMAQLSRERDELRVVTDQIGCPTWTMDLAEALVVLMEKNCEGMFHVVNSGHCSRFEFARKIVEFAGRAIPIHPITSAEYPRAADVPGCTILDCSKLVREAGHSMRPWQDALAAYFADGPLQRTAQIDEA